MKPSTLECNSDETEYFGMSLKTRFVVSIEDSLIDGVLSNVTFNHGVLPNGDVLAAELPYEANGTTVVCPTGRVP